MRLAFLCFLLALQLSAGEPVPLGKLIDIGGYRLHLYCTGKGSPTVMLSPGGGDFSFDWYLVQEKVSAFARVCSYDRAGSAWSDPGPEPRTLRQEAYELQLALRRAKEHGPYILVGHSIGGLVMRIFAERDPAPKDFPKDQWDALNAEKREEKRAFGDLSTNSKIVEDANSGHRVQLDDPDTVIAAIHEVLDAARRHTRLMAAHSVPKSP